VGGTLGEDLVPAVVTFAAGDVMEHHHAIAEFVTGYIFAEGGNHPGGFMAKYPRSGMGPGCNLLQIGAADAAGVHSNQDFARTDPRDRNGLQPDIIDTAINRRLHGCGEGLLTDGTTELGRARHCEILSCYARGTFSSRAKPTCS